MSVTQQLERNLNIVVLMGGWSSERQVSLMSGEGIVEALRRLRERQARARQSST